jgi:hypothetical protein
MLPMDNLLDQYIARFQNIPSFNIHALAGDGMKSVPWYEVTPAIINDLIVNELTIPAQVATIAAEIQKWGRLAALAKRIWELEERGYRAWRSEFMLQEFNPEGKPTGWKKPSTDTVEAMYRVSPEYAAWQIRVERAEEAYNATEALLQAFRAKKDMLMRFAPRYHEQGVPHS